MVTIAAITSALSACRWRKPSLVGPGWKIIIITDEQQSAGAAYAMVPSNSRRSRASSPALPGVRLRRRSRGLDPRRPPGVGAARSSTAKTGVRYNRPEEAPSGASRRRTTAREREGRGPAHPAGLRASGATLRARARPCRAERRPSRGREGQALSPLPGAAGAAGGAGPKHLGRRPPAHNASVAPRA